MLRGDKYVEDVIPALKELKRLTQLCTKRWTQRFQRAPKIAEWKESEDLEASVLFNQEKGPQGEGRGRKVSAA